MYLPEFGRFYTAAVTLLNPFPLLVYSLSQAIHALLASPVLGFLGLRGFY